MNRKQFLLSLAMPWVAGAVSAQSFPAKTITIVVPVVAGGATDVIARALAEELGRQMNQTIIVDNKPGASGMLGTQLVARAVPDGYTLLVTTSGPLLTIPFMVAKAPYDPRKDLSFISQLCTGQLVLAVNKDVPARTMKEFVSWAERNKGKLSYGSYGVGASGHLMSAYLSASRNLDMVHAPYRGETLLIQDMIGGQVAWGIATTGLLLPHISSGRLRALAVMGDQRAADLPDVPTIREAGFDDPELQTFGWAALVGPAGMPAPIMARLEKEVRTALQTSALKARLQTFGMQPMGSTAAEFRRDFENTLPIAERLIKLSGARME